MKRFLLPLIMLMLGPMTIEGQVVPSAYTPLNPCRIFDSTPGPTLTAGTTYWDLARGSCNVPQTANAVALTLTASGASAAGTLKVWDSGSSEPAVSGMAFRGDGTDSSFSIVRLCYPVEECSTEDIAIKVVTSNSHVVLDVVGYFEPLP